MSKHVTVNSRSFSIGDPESITPRVVNIFASNTGDVVFTELCDEYFQIKVSKQEAIDILLKAVAHINSF